MITLNGVKFAETEKEFSDSLFASDGTCVGYAKRNSRSLVLFDQNKKKVGIINKYLCLCDATNVDGEWWYTYATIDLIGEWKSHEKKNQDIDSVAIKISRDTQGNRVAWFKK